MAIYLSFFQQGMSNAAVRDRTRHDQKLSDDLLSLFMYGVTGSQVKVAE